MGFMTQDEAKAAQEAGLEAARSSVPLYDASNANPYALDPIDVNEAPDTDASVAEIEAWVQQHPTEAQRYLDAEQAKDKPRSSLVDSLEKVTDSQ